MGRGSLQKDNPGRRSHMRGFVRPHDFPHIVSGVFQVALGQGAGGTSRAPTIYSCCGSHGNIHAAHAVCCVVSLQP